jgi:ribosomal protein L40E
MSEFTGARGSSGYARTTEHDFKRIIAGDVESVRERIFYALDRLDYRVVSEQPLIAKRRGQVTRCSFSVLKCVKSLTIILKPLNPTSTLVTFNYEILNSTVTKGDRQTIEREAEALLALVAAHPSATVCAYCGANNSSDSHFCRVCGSPNVSTDPVELEVLRLTAGARPAHQAITGAIVMTLVIAAVTLLLIFLTSNTPKSWLTLLIASEIVALSWLFSGMWNLHRTLNPKKEAKQIPATNPLRALPPKQTAALPLPAHASVTEGTTELLDAPKRERVAVPLNSHKADTAEMG